LSLYFLISPRFIYSVTGTQAQDIHFFIIIHFQGETN